MELRKRKAIGIDIGGTMSKVGLVGTEGQMFDSFSVSQKPDIKPEALFATISKEVKQRKWVYESCGIAIAGTVEHISGELIFSPNLFWKNLDIKRYAADLGDRILVENDANAAAWGAYCIEFKRKIKHLICVTLGTGVGGGMILNGSIYRGSHGCAGELGHMTIDPSGPECNCGNNGCLETFVGSKYVALKAYKRLHKELTPLELRKLADKGNKTAIEIFREMGVYLGIGMANVVNILNPELIVFTGGLAGNSKYFINDVIATVKKKAMQPNSSQVKILVSMFTQEMGMMGAACLVLYPSR